MEIRKTKNILRKKHLFIRKQISLERRKDAAINVLHSLIHLNIFTLSFSSLDSEIDLKLLNEHLFRKKVLYLPKVSGNSLETFWVKKWENFKKSEKGILEPSLKNSIPVAPEKIQYALIPGIAFDKKGHRLGFGLGFYDRFLKKNRVKTIGVGFKEQLVDSLPVEPHDIKLDEILLF